MLDTRVQHDLGERTCAPRGRRSGSSRGAGPLRCSTGSSGHRRACSPVAVPRPASRRPTPASRLGARSLAGPGRCSSAPHGNAYASQSSPSFTWHSAPITSGPTLAVSRPVGRARRAATVVEVDPAQIRRRSRARRPAAAERYVAAAPGSQGRGDVSVTHLDVERRRWPGRVVRDQHQRAVPVREGDVGQSPLGAVESGCRGVQRRADPDRTRRHEPAGVAERPVVQLLGHRAVAVDASPPRGRWCSHR